MSALGSSHNPDSKVQHYASDQPARKHVRRTYIRLAGVAKGKEEELEGLLGAEPVALLAKLHNVLRSQNERGMV